MPTFIDTPGGRTVRLVMTVQDGQLSLLSQADVEVAVPPLDAAAAPAPGAYLELHDESGTALGRVHVGGDFVTSIEVVPEAPGQGPTVLPSLTTDAFTVVVPVPDGAVDIVAVRVDPPPGGTGPSDTGPSDAAFLASPATGSVTEVARFRLDTGPA